MTGKDGQREPLLPRHGGYRRLRSFRVAQLIYDMTVRFCERYIDRRSRTRDQMVQAARSGVQNIAEGSTASGTSRKMELKLTNVARASLEELRLDYQDYLRQHGLAEWPPDHPALQRFRARRCSTLAQVRSWAQHEHRSADGEAPPYSALAANAVLSLLNICCHLLDRQVSAQAAAFEAEGGFTERLYRTRRARRRGE
ncbi:MAG: four helix bundle protein [Candidatus Brocadiaceae bacterium]|nr:four helix bundle protein [Candidatus Brocadiaceae bacterium]